MNKKKKRTNNYMKQKQQFPAKKNQFEFLPDFQENNTLNDNSKYLKTAGMEPATPRKKQKNSQLIGQKIKVCPYDLGSWRIIK